jgi:hypothetical protein
MTVSIATPDISCNQPFDVATHDVMCLVKRHAYELVFALPHALHAMADEAQLRLQVHVKWPCQAGGFVLSLKDVERFYEDLGQMIEYWQTERQKIAMSKPVI